MKNKLLTSVLSVFALTLSLGIGMIFFHSLPAQAEPYIAARTGFKCSQCHINQTGGGKRTDFGVIYSQTTLPMRLIKTPDRSSFFDGKLSESVSMGANFRVDEVFMLETESSLGEKLGSSSNSRFSEANLYFEMALIPEKVTLYVDQTVAPTSSNREMFGLVRGLPGSSYVKVGRMLLPYGLRMLDNEAFIRNRTGYTYSRQDIALEIGLEPGPVMLVGNVTDEQVSVVASVVSRRFQLGGSFGRNTTQADDFVVGPFAGANFGRFTFLGEVDLITDGDIDKLAALAEMNVLIQKGFNFKATYEFFDRNRDVDTSRDGQARVTVGVEPFVAQMVQVGVFYRANRFIPQNAAQNQDQAILQFHLFF